MPLVLTTAPRRKPSETTKKCQGGNIWIDRTRKCVRAKGIALSDDMRCEAARELAYAGRYDDALVVLAAISDQSASRVLTYYGFAHRKAGRTALGMQYYTAAIQSDPDNVLARSYMGQGLVAQNDLAGARLQLAEIRARSAASGWPEVALVSVITSGKTYDY